MDLVKAITLICMQLWEPHELVNNEIADERFIMLLDSLMIPAHVRVDALSGWIKMSSHLGQEAPFRPATVNELYALLYIAAQLEGQVRQ